MTPDPYAAVLSDLRAKRDAMNELIAALENVSRLSTPLQVVGVPAVKGEKPSSQPASSRRVPRRASRTPTRRATGDARPEVRTVRPAGSWDASIIAALQAAPDGMTCKALCDALSAPQGSIFAVLQRLVARRTIRRDQHDPKRYVLAGNPPAKEAVQRGA